MRLTSSEQIDVMLGSSLVIPEDPQRTRTNSDSSCQPSGSLSQPIIPSNNNASTSTQPMAFNIPTSNSFESLTEIMDDSNLPGDATVPGNSEYSQNTVARKIRCPPIHVYGTSVTELNQLLPAANLTRLCASCRQKQHTDKHQNKTSLCRNCGKVAFEKYAFLHSWHE